MVFSSLTFLQCFLPVCLLAHFLVPQKWRDGVLFLFSLLFYAWGEPVYVVLMLFSTALDYTCGQMVERHRGQRGAKVALLVSVCVNLGLLGVFKYSDFLIGTVNSLFGTAIPQPNLPLPIGISFYTFQTMSYTIDVYRGEAKAQKNIITFGAYVTLFPQLIAGPIVRYQTGLHRRSVCLRCEAFCLRHRKKGAAGEQHRSSLGNCKCADFSYGADSMAWCDCLWVPALFRLLGLFRYGDWSWADAGLSVP